MKYLLRIKFLGTDFHGFQVQPGMRTVQGTLTESFSKLFAQEVKVTGCSRTDSGVHANDFCITVDTEGTSIPPEKIPVAAARFLPQDISVISAKIVDSDFHPRYNTVSKEYLYRILNAPVTNPFENGRAWWLSHPNIDEEAVMRMNEAAKVLVGKHDFSSFMASGSDIVDTVREVQYLNIQKKNDIIEIRIAADGFLYNMVRIIVGTLVEVAEGKIDSGVLSEILESGKRTRAGQTAPPFGLYLNRVTY